MILAYLVIEFFGGDMAPLVKSGGWVTNIF